MKKSTLSLIGTFIISFTALSQSVSLTPFASGFSSLVEVTHANDARLFAVQQGGLIRIVNPDGTIQPTPFLNVSSVISSGGEGGLLGMAFHPNYAENGYFYLNYTQNGNGSTVIARYQVSSTNPNVADPSTAQILLTISQPFSNHNGGTLKFGPDGYLYIGMGDGGSGGDPGNRSQNVETLLGKMLRIDVNGSAPYTIPADNPYVGTTGADEIFLLGLRNPWKFSFDRENGDLWIADVGQNAVEEINRLTAPIVPGQNLGWRCYEGTQPYNTANCPDVATLTMPITEYFHSGTGGCSVTGGYVYRGTAYPAFSGIYFFGDYCSSKIATYVPGGSINWINDSFSGSIMTFGEDYQGELYVNQGSTLYKITDPNMGVADNSTPGYLVYPNPADRSGILIRSTQLTPIGSYEVFDAQGRMIYSNPAVTAASEVKIPTDSWQSGMYLIQISDSQGKRSNLKVVLK